MAGGMSHLANAFRLSDPHEAIDEFIAVFMGFWESDRAVIRGLGALAVLNPEFAQVLEERYEWRRQGVRTLLERLAKQTGRPGASEMEDASDLLYMLTSFATYDALAGPNRTLEQVTALVQQLAHRGLPH
jgi:hypothetical protein